MGCDDARPYRKLGSGVTVMYPTHERICLWRPAKAVAVPVLYEASNFGSLAAANGETVKDAASLKTTIRNRERKARDVGQRVSDALHNAAVSKLAMDAPRTWRTDDRARSKANCEAVGRRVRAAS